VGETPIRDGTQHPAYCYNRNVFGFTEMSARIRVVIGKSGRAWSRSLS
jgi:hypothetical protein